jgi:hypothetical protein
VDLAARMEVGAKKGREDPEHSWVLCSLIHVLLGLIKLILGCGLNIVLKAQAISGLQRFGNGKNNGRFGGVHTGAAKQIAGLGLADVLPK